MKLCKDCRWCSEIRMYNNEDTSRCKRLDGKLISKTNGEVISSSEYSFCEIERRQGFIM